MTATRERSTNCQVLDFICEPADLCTVCKGTGDHPRAELCQHCDYCFDDVIGWSTGIEPGSASQLRAREFVRSVLQPVPMTLWTPNGGIALSPEARKQLVAGLEGKEVKDGDVVVGTARNVHEDKRGWIIGSLVPINSSGEGGKVAAESPQGDAH